MSHALTETYQTSSSDETKKLGREIGESLSRATLKNLKLNGPIVLALQGDLGAGKTTFIQGFMKGLGSKKRVTSPTFILMRRHKVGGATKTTKTPKPFSNVFHIDAYRLKKPEQFGVLGLEDILKDPRNIVLIEWPEQAKKLIPKNALWLKFEYGKKENQRTITIKR
jgi:tRNA threonylcarbamoyladenosine biosynthesis protein TsaE